MHLLYWFVFVASVGFIRSHKDENPIVILISFDGFRSDYLEKVETPYLTSLVRNGVQATVINNFVTKTFPNHYSIVTGMYEQRHGLINNYMYDPVFNESFGPSNIDPKWYNAAEPVWNTNQKYGDGRLSAVVNWVGSYVPINGQLPKYHMPYDSTMSYEARIDFLMKHLDTKPSANFLAAYFEEPDHSGHHYGPDSLQVVNAVKKVDKVAGYLVKELKTRNLIDKVNIIFTSDHGMTKVNSSKMIFLDEHVRPETYTLVDYGVNAFIIPHTDQEKHAIYQNLTRVPHISVFYKEEIPEVWHYAHNRRVTPIFVTSHLGYRVVPNAGKTPKNLGDHGYNNSQPDMHPFFVAHGPAFKEGLKSQPFSIVHIYALMCHLLDIKPSPNDGDINMISHILKSENNTYILFIILMSIAVVVCLIVVIGIYRNLCRQPKISWKYGHNNITNHYDEEEPLFQGP